MQKVRRVQRVRRVRRVQRKSENILIDFVIPKKFVNRLLIYVVFPVYAYIIFIKISFILKVNRNRDNQFKMFVGI